MLVAIAHPLMRALTLELLARDHACWRAKESDGRDLAGVMRSMNPDLVVIDTASFNECRGTRADHRFPSHRMVVIGPEPDAAYRVAALDVGAGGWVARDFVAEQLSNAMRAALGCTHGPCPDDGHQDTLGSEAHEDTRAR